MAANRAERRAQVFLRKPKAKELEAVDNTPHVMNSGIRPLIDPLDQLLLGQTFREVPQAVKDGDLMAPTPFVPREVEYIARFQGQVCQCSQRYIHFVGLFAKQVGGQRYDRVLNCPDGTVPAVEHLTTECIPFCTECLNGKA